MCEIVIHRRVFEEEQKVLEFDTAVDVFKVIHFGVYEGLPAVWYETLEKPVYRRSVRFELVYTNQCIPERSVHVGSTMLNSNMFHCYQIVERV
jgi:hypothetical protein